MYISGLSCWCFPSPTRFNNSCKAGLLASKLRVRLCVRSIWCPLFMLPTRGCIAGIWLYADNNEANNPSQYRSRHSRLDSVPRGRFVKLTRLVSVLCEAVTPNCYTMVYRIGHAVTRRSARPPICNLWHTRQMSGRWQADVVWHLVKQNGKK